MNYGEPHFYDEYVSFEEFARRASAVLGWNKRAAIISTPLRFAPWSWLTESGPRSPRHRRRR